MPTSEDEEFDDDGFDEEEVVGDVTTSAEGPEPVITKFEHDERYGAATLFAFVDHFAEFAIAQPERCYFELYRDKPALDDNGNDQRGRLRRIEQSPDTFDDDFIAENFGSGTYHVLFVGPRGGRERLILGRYNNLRIAPQIERKPVPAAKSEAGRVRREARGFEDVPRQPSAAPAPVVAPDSGVAKALVAQMSAQSEMQLEALLKNREAPRDAAAEGSAARIEAAIAKLAEIVAVPPAPPPQDRSADMLLKLMESQPKVDSEREKSLLGQIDSMRKEIADSAQRAQANDQALSLGHQQAISDLRAKTAEERLTLIAEHNKAIFDERERARDDRDRAKTQRDDSVKSAETGMQARLDAVNGQLTDMRETNTELRAEVITLRASGDGLRGDLTKAQIDAATATKGGSMDNIEGLAKNIETIKGVASGLGASFVAGDGAAVAESTMGKLADAAGKFAGSSGFTALGNAVAARMGAPGAPPMPNPGAAPANAADAAAAWAQHQGQTSTANAQAAIDSAHLALPPSPEAAPPAAAPNLAELTMEQRVALIREGIEIAVEQDMPLDVFIPDFLPITSLDRATIYDVLQGAPNTEVHTFFGIEPGDLTMAGQRYFDAVLNTLRDKKE